MIAPRDDRAVCPQGHIMIVTGGDPDHVGRRRRNRRLPIRIIPPGDNRAVGPQRQTVFPAGCDRYHVAHCRWCRIIKRPSHYCPIRPQSDVVVVPRSNGDNTHAEERKVRLAVIVISPDHDHSVRPQRQAVRPARRNRNHVGGHCWHIGLSISVASPSNNRTILSYSEAVGSTSSNSHYVRGCGGDVGLPVPVLPPRNDRAVHVQSKTVETSSGDRTWIRDDNWDLGLAVKIIAHNIETAHRNSRGFTRHAARGIRNDHLITHIVASEGCGIRGEGVAGASARHAIREPLVMERVASGCPDRQREWAARRALGSIGYLARNPWWCAVADHRQAV